MSTEIEQWNFICFDWSQFADFYWIQLDLELIFLFRKTKLFWKLSIERNFDDFISLDNFSTNKWSEPNRKNSSSVQNLTFLLERNKKYWNWTHSVWRQVWHVVEMPTSEWNYFVKWETFHIDIRDCLDIKFNFRSNLGIFKLRKMVLLSNSDVSDSQMNLIF